MTGSVAGVDGCRAGWVAVVLPTGAAAQAKMLVTARFAEQLETAHPDTIFAVDMPIGLPDAITKGGRGPEQAVRPHLGERRSSVFSIPSRASVMAEDYGEACSRALETSDPPRKVSKQGFYLFPKIRELDALLTPSLEQRVYEVHPELAFWRLNGEAPVPLPKKVKGRVSDEGIAARISLLIENGFERAFLEQPLPRGVGRDDLIDAAACALIARRIAQGHAEPFPKDFTRDARGLRVAIWA